VIGQARLLASRVAHSGSWIWALPSVNLGLRFGNEETRVAIGLQVGTSLVLPHQCGCGIQVSEDGLHGLSCRRSAGRQSRHAAINMILARALRSSGTPCLLEPPNLLRE